MLDHLKALGDHIASLDSGSKDAMAIRWAVNEIERLRSDLAISAKACSASSDSATTSPSLACRAGAP